MNTNIVASTQLAAIRKTLDMSDDEVIQIAIQRLYNEVFFDQGPDDGPLSEEYLNFLQSKANAELNSPVEFNQSLFK